MRRAAKALFAGLLIAATPAVQAAPYPQSASLSEVYNAETNRDFRVGMQMRLAWVGDYAGAFHGDIDAASLRAIRDFQARHAMAANGVIDEPMLRLLVVESDRAESAAGFELVEDETTGARIGLPLAWVGETAPTDLGRIWRSDDGGIEIETVRMADGRHTLDSLYSVLKRSSTQRSVTAESLDERFFTIAGRERGRAYVMRFSGSGRDIRGFAVSYEDAWANSMAPVVTVAANLFDPFFSETGEASVADAERLPSILGAAAGRSGGGLVAERSLLESGIHPDGGAIEGDGEDGPGRDSSGSGFVVSHDGWVLTNAHVAKSCKTILVGSKGPADDVVLDEANDLALVHVAGDVGQPIPVSLGVPRLGEDVLALGYPLRSILADSLNVTRGNVSSLLGLMNDPRYLQISAPIQPGNSGGPLVDLAGRVVGVVTAKLNAVAVADATGDIPQSINFAIRPDAAVRFLEANGVDFVPADVSKPFASVADTTESVQDAVLPVLCLGAD